MKNYDVIIIGSGGGSKITSPAARLGLKVACIEKDALGGTCLNRGCIPSKMLIHPADVAMEIKHAHRFDIHNDPKFTVDFKKLITRISNAIDHDSQSIEASYTKNPNIDYYHGAASFVSNYVVEINGQQITAPKIFIAVGTRPTIPNIEGLNNTPFMTSTEALRNTTLPKKLIVVGAGYIATELGYAYSALGCEVHFLVRSRFLKGEDLQVAQEFTRVFQKHQHIHFSAVPTRVEHDGQNFTVTFDAPEQKQQTLQADALLMAAGITPNNDTLNLQSTNIGLTPKGFIKVDDHMQTTVEGVWALGDCVGNYFFRHSVNFEGEYLFDQIFKNAAKAPIDYPPVPHAVFTYPQIAGVGQTEEQLKNANVEYVIGLNPYEKSAMGMALCSDYGFCKILFDRYSQKILGAHIIGPEASDMIHLLIAFMNKDGNLDDLLKMIYIHPALPEIVRNAARKAKVEFDKLPKATKPKPEAAPLKLIW